MATTVQPVEFRVQAGLNEPAINLYLQGEISRQLLVFPRQDRTITALQVAEALREAFLMGVKLGHLATKPAPKKRTKKAVEPVAAEEDHATAL